MYETGQVLVVQYLLFKHYGIYVGENKVIHNSKKFFRVEEIDLVKFSDNRGISKSTIEAPEPEVAAQTAKKYLGLPYGLFSENCERFVRMICGLVKESTQVQKYLISTLGIGAFLKSDSAVVKAAAAATIATILTPEEKSPYSNAALTACLVAGIALLASG